ncbi:SPFH domain-containing protein [Streptomyces niveus]|uniref:SPFH domain-containing protein n=1 Tax=Streptomyces niveus TaxID=193462 RepID=UPI000AA3A5E1|nr:SPFH domain-containing protein [Streptomyces niveus]
MTTQTSQPNGDGQMLRGAPALRAAARNALTAREPADPVEPVDPAEPLDPADQPDPPTGWYQNVRLLTGPPQEGEPPGPTPTTPTTAPEVSDIVEWASAEKERERGREPEPEAESAASAEYGSGARPEWEADGPASTGYGAVADAERDARVSARAVHVEPKVAPAWGGGAVASPAHVNAEARPAWLAKDSASAAYAPVADEGAEVRAAYVEPQDRPVGDRDGSGSAGYTGSKSRSGSGVEGSAPADSVESDASAAYAPVADVDAGVGAEPDAGVPARGAYAEPQVRPVGDRDDSGSKSRSGSGVEGSAPADSVEPDASAAHAPAAHVATEVGAEPDASARAAYVEPQDHSAGDWDNSDSESQGSAPADSVDPQDHPVGHGGHPHSGIPAPVWDVSVPAGVGGVVPTRASVTFDSHRWSPLIVGEATHEIPVHLLFRDDEATGPVAGRPRARRAPVVPAPVLAPAASSRPATPVDTKLVERPGPTLPGWTAALVGVAALFGCVVVLWWVGAVPDALTEMFGLASNPYNGIGIGMWALLTVAVSLTLFAFGGLGRGRVGHAWVLTLFGEYRGSVRRTGLLWVSPLLLRRRVDVRLRHWRSEPMPAVDANGTALRVVVLVVWRVRDTVRAALGVRDHEEYLREQVEAAMARVLSQLPADAFHEAAPTLRNAEAVGEALTRMLSAECRPVGLDVFSAQPTRIEYAPEISAAMQRSRIAAIDARHRDTVLTSVVDAVDDTVHRLTSRGLVELDDYERKVLVKDLTVAFYTGRHGLNEGN